MPLVHDATLSNHNITECYVMLLSNQAQGHWPSGSGEDDF